MFKGLLQGIGSKMKDSGGLFQGGQQGRLFGRLRDKLPGGNLMNKARDFATGMDVESNEDVLQMQGMLNKLGFKDYEGKSLLEDSMIGERTLSALRQLQGTTKDKDQMSSEYPGKEQGGNSVSSNMQSLFGSGEEEESNLGSFDNMYDRQNS